MKILNFHTSSINVSRFCYKWYQFQNFVLRSLPLSNKLFNKSKKVQNYENSYSLNFVFQSRFNSFLFIFQISIFLSSQILLNKVNIFCSERTSKLILKTSYHNGCCGIFKEVGNIQIAEFLFLPYSCFNNIRVLSALVYSTILTFRGAPVPPFFR